MHELGVIETLSLNCSTDSCDPELSEVALLFLSSAICILASLCDSVLSNAVIGASATIVALCLLENFLPSVLSFGSVNCSWQIGRASCRERV